MYVSLFLFHFQRENFKKIKLKKNSVLKGLILNQFSALEILTFQHLNHHFYEFPINDGRYRNPYTHRERDSQIDK